MEQEKVFLKEGDTVTLVQNLPNKPIMIVEKVERVRMKKVDADPMVKGTTLLGIRTFWFDTIGGLHTHRFNAKDLIRA